MPARLFSKVGPLAGTEFLVDQEAVIGRDSRCDLVLFPHTISSRHARIFFDQDKQAYYIEDLDSSNGTRVDRIPLGRPVRLDGLHVITFASDIAFIFQQVTTMPAPTPARPGPETTIGVPPPPPPELAPDRADEGMRTTYGNAFDVLPDLGGMGSNDTLPPAVRTPEPALPERALELERPDGSTETITLAPGTYTIGRLSTNDIVITDSFVSSKHAELLVTDAFVELTDLESSNHTFVDGAKISEKTRLAPGATLRFGPKATAVLR